MAPLTTESPSQLTFARWWLWSLSRTNLNSSNCYDHQRAWIENWRRKWVQLDFQITKKVVTSRYHVSSLRKVPANLLCIVPILLGVKRHLLWAELNIYELNDAPDDDYGSTLVGKRSFLSGLVVTDQAKRWKSWLTLSLFNLNTLWRLTERVHGPSKPSPLAMVQKNL